MIHPGEDGPRLIINADDLGLSETVNEAITQCFETGLITSATLMANMPAFEAACRSASERGWTDCIGVHLNFSEGEPLTEEMRRSRRFCDGERFALGRARPWRLPSRDRDAIEAETAAQVSRCREHGVEPTHADSHHHLHTAVPVSAPVVRALRRCEVASLRRARNLAPPSTAGLKGVYKTWLHRRVRSAGLWTTGYFCGLDEFLAARRQRPLRHAVYEIMVHPTLQEDGRLVDAVDGLPLDDRIREATRETRQIPYPRR